MGGSRVRSLCCGLGIVAVGLALSGCGSSSPSSSVTSVIELKSPDVGRDGITRPGVECGFGPIWLNLEWEKAPAGTKELALYFTRFRYVKTAGGRKPVPNYADLLSDIEPSLRHLPANELPNGAQWSYIGRSCPAQRTGERLLAEVLALDKARQPRKLGFHLATRLTEEALADPKPSEGPRSPGTLTQDVAAIGRLLATDGPPRE